MSTDQAGRLTQAIWQRTLELAPELGAEEFVNVLWAMSEFRVEGSWLCHLADGKDLGPELLSRFAAALAELCRRQDAQNPQNRSRARKSETSNYASCSEQRFFEVVAEEALQMTWPSTRRARLVWSFACMHLRHVALFEHVLGASRWEICAEGDLADICWALVTVQAAEPETSFRLEALLPHLRRQQLPHWLWLLLLWCFAMADIVVPKPLQEHICNCLSASANKGGGSGLGSMGSSWNEIDARMFDQVVALFGWKPQISSSCRAPSNVNPSTPSAFQRDVFDMLSELGLGPEFEVEGFDLLLRDRGLAIEVNGPSHYAIDLEHLGHHAELGRSLLKRRLAMKMGYGFITVPWWEWDRAVSQRGGRRDYLEQLISRTSRVDPSSTQGAPISNAGYKVPTNDEDQTRETVEGYGPVAATLNTVEVLSTCGKGYKDLSVVEDRPRQQGPSAKPLAPPWVLSRLGRKVLLCPT